MGVHSILKEMQEPAERRQLSRVFGMLMRLQVTDTMTKAMGTRQERAQC